MPKLFTVQIEVPSGSRTTSYAEWLNKLLIPHRMKATNISWSQEEDDRYFDKNAKE